MITLPSTRYERLRRAVATMCTLAEGNLDDAEGAIMEAAAADDVAEWQLLLGELDEAAGISLQRAN